MFSLFLHLEHDLTHDPRTVPFDGRSDYAPFIRSGIPGGGVTTGAEVIKTKEEEAMFGGKAGVAYDYVRQAASRAADIWLILL
jgi:Zn-dependent M28 family amino/carboxypeptidase